MRTLFFILFFVFTGFSNVFAQNQTSYEKKVLEIKVKYLSIFYYGYEKELTLSEKFQIESLIKDKSEEQEAAVLANLVMNYAMSHSETEMDNLLKRFQNEMKNAEKLKTDADISSSKTTNSKENLSFSAFAKIYVDEQLTKWQEKGEFEKTSDWQIRVNEETTKKKIELFNENAIDAYAKYLQISFDKRANLTLGSYDADREIYIIEHKYFGQLPVSVPLQEAESFRGTFKYSVSTFTTDIVYFILNDKLELAEATFIDSKNIGNDVKYKYENPLAKNRKKQTKEVYALAKIYFNNKEYQQAINHYEKIIEFNIDLMESEDWKNLSVAYFQTENYAEVIDCYDNYKANGKTGFNNFILATSYLKLKNYSKAIEIYSKLSNLNSLGLEIEKHNNMAECYIGIGEHNKAIDLLERFIERSRHNAKTYYILGNAYKATNNNRKAKEAYKIAAKNGSKEAQDILNKK